LTLLNEAGFDEDKIGLVMPGRHYKESAGNKNGSSLGKKTGMAAAAGVSLGGLAGFLAGGVSIPVPGAESLVASGVLVSVLGGAAAGATYGALAGILLGLEDLDEPEVDTFNSGLVDEGRILLVVEAKGERALEARRIIRQASESVSTSAEASDEKLTGQDRGR